MITFDGHYFNGWLPINIPARMDFTDQEAKLTSRSVSQQYSTSLLKVSPRVGSTERFISLPDGGQFACADHAFLDSLPQEIPSEGIVAWLEDRWGIALICVTIIMCVLTVGYFFCLPVAAKHVVARIPFETEQAMGTQALAWLDEKGFLRSTSVHDDNRKKIMEGFKGLCEDLPLRDYYSLEFRSSPAFRANAFAFPGGVIVITDDMVNAAESTEEVLAILAHEIGHVHYRHAMRSVLQNSIIAVAITTVTADAATLNVVISGIPMSVAQAKYSRRFENEADEYAFELLKRKDYSPAAFALIMERLSRQYGDESRILTYISTHPSTRKRIERARDTAAN